MPFLSHLHIVMMVMLMVMLVMMMMMMMVMMVMMMSVESLRLLLILADVLGNILEGVVCRCFLAGLNIGPFPLLDKSVDL